MHPGATEELPQLRGATRMAANLGDCSTRIESWEWVSGPDGLPAPPDGLSLGSAAKSATTKISTSWPIMPSRSGQFHDAGG